MKRIIGGTLGFVVGFTVGILIFEVAWPNDYEWTTVFEFGLAVLGALSGSALFRRLGHHAPDRHASAQ